MADITISDLELAPALADDMVLAVENTTDTYAATLAMLRRLINKTFVEVENADFNALTDDGFYQCTGTPTNSPVAGAINWTLQVSAENGVVVQRAFSLDDNFANMYIRRFNGVTWTGWLDVGKGALDNKANVSNTVTMDTAQTISGTKTFSVGTLQAVNPVLLKENNADEGGQIHFERSDNSVLRSNPYIDLLINKIRFVGVNSQNVLHIPFEVDLENNTVAVPTPAANANDPQVATTAWVNAKLALCMPDYSAVIELTKANGTTTQKGLLAFKSVTNFYAVEVVVGSLPLLLSGSYNDRDCLTLPVDKGTSYSCANWGVVSNLYLVPFKGVV